MIGLLIFLLWTAKNRNLLCWKKSYPVGQSMRSANIPKSQNQSRAMDVQYSPASQSSYERGYDTVDAEEITVIN